jgi:NAD(P)-dependent dehydrogenase (short-subunit alcohol dehydrogenase family)
MNERRQVALVTGGSSGIGLAISRALLGRGWSVAICGRDGEKLERAAADLRAEQGTDDERLVATRADVSSVEDVRAWVRGSSEALGDPDLLVNNAGVGARGAIAELDEESWDRAQAINAKGAFLCTREVLAPMRRRGGGWIINVASLAGKKGMPGSAAYSASKFALVGFTEALAREEAKNNIRATAICPGYVATPMVAGARAAPAEMAQPEDIAATVLYLLDLSPAAVIREIVIERLGVL